ncbi:MAG: hypothetical protein OXG97_14720 [Candidatus Poribacteria bacterium]|nr:hypothetical protein [Candidatus Poribacteria bacterium]
MKELSLKPTHKPIRDCYEALEQYNRLDIIHEIPTHNKAILSASSEFPIRQ